MILIEELTKSYKTGLKKRSIAVDCLNLAVNRGDVFGFLGPNGAGKSTVIKIIMDFIRADKGKALIDGRPASDTAVRRLIGYLPENPLFYDHLTAKELLGFCGRANGMKKEHINARGDELLERLGLADAASRQIRGYSKGMTQRIGLALALIHEPELCILDEPMSGLDPLGRRMVADLILDLKKGCRTVFFSSHILSDIERLCNRIGILHKGRLLFSGQLNELTGGNRDLESAFLSLVKGETL